MGRKTQIFEFDYSTKGIDEIQDQLDTFHEHYDVKDINVTQSGDQILVFLFYED
jgi:hypothetical protein